ncbi:MAG: TraR/DksA C4-type zinc finger protein [Pseudomonadota bacterium]
MTIDYEVFKKLLIDSRIALQTISEASEDSAKPVELDQTRVGRVSRMDAMQAQAMSLETQRRRELQLKKVAAALARLESGDFGYCAQCGDEINVERLKIEPTTLLCIQCAEQREQQI